MANCFHNFQFDAASPLSAPAASPLFIIMAYTWRRSSLRSAAPVTITLSSNLWFSKSDIRIKVGVGIILILPSSSESVIVSGK